MNKIKTILLNFWKEIKDECYWTFIGLITGALFSFMLTNSAWETRLSKHNDEVRLENVRHFIEHPSAYKLDTLYRKSNDTLFIDTIKVNYK